MAIAVDREQVAQGTMAAALSVKPQLSYVQRQRRYQAPVVRCWRLDEDGRTLHLPFAWAQKELGVCRRPPTAYELYRPPADRLEFRGELYPEQQAPADEAFAELAKSGGVTLAMRTGFGKTVVGIWLVARLQPYLALIVYSFNTCEREWADAFREFTSAAIWQARTEKLPPGGFHVILCSVGTLEHIPAAVLANVGILVVDEVHTFFTEIRTKALLRVHPRYVVAISATPAKENQMHRVLTCLAGPKQVRVPGRPFRVRQVRTGVRPACAHDADGSLLWNSVLEALAQSPARNALIADEVVALIEAGRKPLVLTARVAHTLALAELIARRTPQKVSVFQENMKTYEDGAVLLGTKGKLSTGFDEKAFVQATAGAGFKRIDTVVVVFPIADCAGLLVQVIGRAFRTEEVPLVVEFRDDHPATERQARKRNKLYRSLGVPVDVVEAPLADSAAAAAAAAAAVSPDGADLAEEAWLAARIAANRALGPKKNAELGRGERRDTPRVAELNAEQQGHPNESAPAVRL